VAVQLYVSRVSDVLPAVTVIVPTRPAQSEIAAVDAARALDYPQDKLEIIVARGKQPAVQRNKALEAATGELIDGITPAVIANDGPWPRPGRPDHLNPGNAVEQGHASSQ